MIEYELQVKRKGSNDWRHFLSSSHRSTLEQLANAYLKSDHKGDKLRVVKLEKKLIWISEVIE